MEALAIGLWAFIAYACVAFGAWVGLRDEMTDCKLCAFGLAVMWPCVLLFRFGVWVVEPR